MSETRSSTRVVTFPWFLAFIVLKLANVPAGMAAWSWWWLLFPIAPVLVELVKLAAQ